MSRPTIADVARRCGVSKTTVSVILNNSLAGSSARVSEDTQRRVKRAAAELGYAPSWRGRALKSRQTQMIGVLYTPPMKLVVRGNYEGIMVGINEVLQRESYHMLYVPLGDNPADWRKIILDQRMDGALVLSRLRDPLHELIQQAKLPIALVNAQSDHSVPQVIADEYDGARQVTNHLLELGHQRVTFVLGEQPPHFSVSQRQDGYTSAMRDAGLSRHAEIITGTIPDYVKKIAASRNRPTGLVVYTHYMAIKLLQVLWEHGLRVPDDLSVVTFCNAYPVEDVIPPLTTMSLPTEEMGRLAAEMVLEQIKTSGEAEKRRVVLREELVVRKSSAAPAR